MTFFETEGVSFFPIATQPSVNLHFPVHHLLSKNQEFMKDKVH
jgi:hypothetical protein